MNPKDIHIVFNQVGQTLLNLQLPGLCNIRLISLEDTLHIGPIGNLHIEENIKKREAWLSAIFGDIYYNEELSIVEKDLKRINSLVENPETINDIYMWTGYSTSEIISTARLVSYLSDLNKNIFIIDFPNIPVKRKDGITMYPHSLIETNESQIKELAKHFYLISPNDLQKWEKIWKEIEQNNTMLRILDKDGIIREKDETYFDSFLLSNCNGEFQYAVKVIGRTLCDISFSVGESFLNWRLKKLASAGKIETYGLLRNCREYEIKNTFN